MFYILKGVNTRKKKKTMSTITQKHIFCMRFAIFVHILGTCSDYSIAIRYLWNGETANSISIICLMLISSLINVLISRRMQQRDKEYNSIDTDDYCRILHLITKNRLFLVIAIPLKLAPIIHYWKTSKCALKAFRYKKSGDLTNEKRYCSMMYKKHRDASLLRVFECYLDAAPQQILQLTLMLNSYDNKINFELHKVISIVFSIVHMSASMAEYHSVIRLAQEDKLNIDGIGQTLHFFWHFCITVARILSLSIITSIWPIYVILCCIIHWIGMTIWILIDSKNILNFCQLYDHSHMQPSFKKNIYSVLLASVIGIVYIFMYINTAESNVWKYVSFYILCFMENTISDILWEYYCPPAIRNVWYFNKLHIISFGFFALGIVAMVLYYKVFHPSKKSNKNRASPNIPTQRTSNISTISYIPNEVIEL